MLVAQQREGIACATTPQPGAEMEQSKAENFLWLGVQGCTQWLVFERYTDFFLSIFCSLSIPFTCSPFNSEFHFAQLVG